MEILLNMQMHIKEVEDLSTREELAPSPGYNYMDEPQMITRRGQKHNIFLHIIESKITQLQDTCNSRQRRRAAN